MRTGLLLTMAVAFRAHAQEAKALATPAPLPDLGLSVVRVLGALVFVVGVFLIGVWALRRWQQRRGVRAGGPRLAILDTRSLGGRQALFVVGYERQRLLISASPSGVSLIAHLPEGEEAREGACASADFGTILQDVFSRKAP